MCTLSLIRPPSRMPGTEFLRVLFSRDESVTRAIGLPPATFHVGGRTAIYPRDPESGGTWIAANSAGLVCALLNRSDHHTHPHPTPRSRGTLIPALLACGSVREAMECAQVAEESTCRAFRLFIFHRTSFGRIDWDGVRLDRQLLSPPPGGFMAASSGLGDEMVRLPRQRLFDQWMAADPTSAAAQDRFHRTAWPDAPHLSPLMDRPGARTVSLTTILVEPHRLNLHYRPRLGSGFGPGHTVQLDLEPSPARAVSAA